MKYTRVPWFVILLAFIISTYVPSIYSQTTLIPAGAVWRYFDEPGDPPANWFASDFSAHIWPGGNAQFGYGEQDEATLVRGGPTYGIYTHYFQHKFVVARAADYTNLVVNVLRDDGVVVYLNGQEVFRMNMPPGTITRQTEASNQVMGSDESFFFPTNVNAALLINGTNTLAVELHQTTGSGDGSFDLSLIGFGPPRDIRPSLDLGRAGSKLMLRWEGTNSVLERTWVPGWNWEVLPEARSPYEADARGGSALFRLRVVEPAAP
ncbi:MAG TPA: hypothetical protein VK615_04940 [Candidatus Binatia bacterium]|nr:hypothetical protein [Candidatus Binatia bacterium]